MVSRKASCQLVLIPLLIPPRHNRLGFHGAGSGRESIGHAPLFAITRFTRSIQILTLFSSICDEGCLGARGALEGRDFVLFPLEHASKLSNMPLALDIYVITLQEGEGLAALLQAWRVRAAYREASPKTTKSTILNLNAKI